MFTNKARRHWVSQPRITKCPGSLVPWIRVAYRIQRLQILELSLTEYRINMLNIWAYIRAYIREQLWNCEQHLRDKPDGFKNNGLPSKFSWYRICLQCRRLWFDSWVRKIRWRRDIPIPIFLVFPVTQQVKNLPAMWETWVCSLGWEDPLEKWKATHYSILA